MSVAKRQRHVLVLNKGWNAIGVVSLERAIVMLFSSCKDQHGNVLRDTDGEEIPKARIIDPTRDFQDFTWKKWSQLKVSAGEDCIRSCNMVFRVPEVIVLSKYDKMPQHKIHFSRRTIYKRDGNQCQYCSRSPGTEELTIDHVIPRSVGGKTTWDNCVLACIECNSNKADRVPECTKVLDRVKDKNDNWKNVEVPGFIVTFVNKKTSQIVKKTIKKPKKPTTPLFKGDVRIKSWENFLGESYWLVELENDMSE